MKQQLRLVWLAWLVVAAISGLTRADEAAWPPIQALLPPAGIEIAADERAKLESALAELEKKFATATEQLGDADNVGLLVDVEIYPKAVRFALERTEFYRPQDVKLAHELLETAEKRLAELAAGKASWGQANGLVVRGYRSQVDGSVQPYGLVVPEQLPPGKVPLYVWLHGRADKQLDLQFIGERQRSVGQVQVNDAIVLHPFGRSCLGWKSTAEVDVLEAIDSVAARYPIDRDRVVLMGFSMGGAGAWHIGAHYADHFAGVHAGAGFVDVARYTNLKPAGYPPPYELKLWGVYDVPNYVRNLFNLPVVAYSGELDKQKDAADFMAEAFQAYGRTLEHLIGPGMGHKYDPAVWKQVMERMQAAASQGRSSVADSVSLQTRTLRYSRMHWVEALALDEHWRDSRLDVRFAGDDALEVQTANLQAFKLTPPRPVRSLTIDGQTLSPGEPWRYEKHDGRWQVAAEQTTAGLRKRPGLQGPIDDAFLEPFLVVTPSGRTSPELQRWIDFELDHFQRRWRGVYRGQLRVKRDQEVTANDLARYHVVVWGDPTSNAFIRRVADQLPIRWTAAELSVGERQFAGNSHLPLLIYPNPLNPAKYLVLNSGPTHREAHDRTNSLQNPKLPDWAIVDVRVAPNAESPGRVVAAGFFDEQWQVRESAAGK